MRLYAYLLSLAVYMTCLIQTGFAQDHELEFFDGPYTINDTLNGTARYSYFLNEDGIKIMDGAFKFTQRSQDTAGKFNHYTYHGNYESGLKKGAWVYENHTYDVAVSDINEQLRADVSVGGIQTRLQAYYEKGKAEGDWIYEEFLVAINETKKNLSNMEVSFSEGRMVGEFNYEGHINGKPAHIQGVFNDAHFFESEWTLAYTIDTTSYNEVRAYDNGFLTHIKVSADTTVLYDYTFSTVEEKILQSEGAIANEGFYIDDRYFGFLFDDGFPTASPQIRSQLNGNKILEQITGKLFNQEIGGLQLSGALYIEPGATRRFHYMHSDEDRSKLTQLDSLLSQYKSEISKYTENSVLSINRQRADSLALSYSMLENMLVRLQTIEKSAAVVKSNEFRNQSMENYFRGGIQHINSVDTIRYSFGGEEKVEYVHYETRIENGFDIFQQKIDYVEEIGSQFAELVPFLDQSLVEIDQDDRIASLEEEVSTLLSHVDVLYSGAVENEEQRYMVRELLTVVLRNFQRMRDNALKKYAETNDFEEKTELGSRLVADSKKMVEMHPQIAHVDIRLDELNEAYLVYTSNRFLEDHSIRTRVKRGIYTTGVEFLIPELLSQIKSSESLEEMADLSEKLDDSLRRLMAISELDNSATQRLDRQMRNQTDIDRILQLLEV